MYATTSETFSKLSFWVNHWLVLKFKVAFCGLVCVTPKFVTAITWLFRNGTKTIFAFGALAAVMADWMAQIDDVI